MVTMLLIDSMSSIIFNFCMRTLTGLPSLTDHPRVSRIFNKISISRQKTKIPWIFAKHAYLKFDDEISYFHVFIHVYM